MTGFIKITVSEVDKKLLEECREARNADDTIGANVSSEVSLQHVNIIDKFILLQALMQAINLSKNDLKMYLLMQDCGVLEHEQEQLDMSEEEIE